MGRASPSLKRSMTMKSMGWILRLSEILWAQAPKRL
jgi:hypothetical protein